MNKLKIGCFGSNGHQIWDELTQLPEGEVIAVGGISSERLSKLPAEVHVYDTYEEMLQHPGLQLISLCSPIRAQQFAHICAALHAGLHVYAEKPMVMQSEQLAEVLHLAQRLKLHIREMAPTAYESPYDSMHPMVERGTIGQVVQFYAQKSYPYAAWRPQDEAVDGGLMLQAGIHLVRAIERVTGQLVAAISATQTKIGNPHPDGHLHMASNLHIQLENGAIGVAAINYLNVASSEVWGNDRLTIFGSQGYMEWSAQTNQVRVYTDAGKQEINCLAEKSPTHFRQFVQEIQGQAHRLMPVEQELHPLRVILTARQSAQSQSVFIPTIHEFQKECR